MKSKKSHKKTWYARLGEAVARYQNKHPGSQFFMVSWRTLRLVAHGSDRTIAEARLGLSRKQRQVVISYQVPDGNLFGYFW